MSTKLIVNLKMRPKCDYSHLEALNKNVAILQFFGNQINLFLSKFLFSHFSQILSRNSIRTMKTKQCGYNVAINKVFTVIIYLQTECI